VRQADKVVSLNLVRANRMLEGVSLNLVRDHGLPSGDHCREEAGQGKWILMRTLLR
jgi:hypothetical protein